MGNHSGPTFKMRKSREKAQSHPHIQNNLPQRYSPTFAGARNWKVIYGIPQ